MVVAGTAIQADADFGSRCQIHVMDLLRAFQDRPRAVARQTAEENVLDLDLLVSGQQTDQQARSRAVPGVSQPVVFAGVLRDQNTVRARRQVLAVQAGGRAGDGNGAAIGQVQPGEGQVKCAGRVPRLGGYLTHDARNGRPVHDAVVGFLAVVYGCGKGVPRLGLVGRKFGVEFDGDHRSGRKVYWAAVRLRMNHRRAGADKNGGEGGDSQRPASVLICSGMRWSWSCSFFVTRRLTGVGAGLFPAHRRRAGGGGRFSSAVFFLCRLFAYYVYYVW